MINNSSLSRRTLVTGSVAIAGSAAVAVAPLVAAPVSTADPVYAARLDREGSPDPVFAAIKAHQKAVEAYNVAARDQDRLEREILNNKRRTSRCDDIVQTDDPRWIAHIQELDRSAEAESDAERELASIVPSSMRGVLALLQYATTDVARGHEWSELVDDDGVQQTWFYFVHRNVIEALETSLGVEEHGGL